MRVITIFHINSNFYSFNLLYAKYINHINKIIEKPSGSWMDEAVFFAVSMVFYVDVNVEHDNHQENIMSIINCQPICLCMLNERINIYSNMEMN